jgi:hypothetical protein
MVKLISKSIFSIHRSNLKANSEECKSFISSSFTDLKAAENLHDR